MIPLAPTVPATAPLSPPSFDARWRSTGDRIRALVDQYVTTDHLRDRLEDLPNQLDNPHLRPWRPLPWAQVGPDQLVGIDPAVFCQILAGAIDTEAPIRGYTQSSRQYLSALYPAMARFVGGTVDGQGQLVELGLWEREEKRHTPALIKLYRCLSGEAPTVRPHVARPYAPHADARADLYRHGLHRVATEYGAACLYLWMMAHCHGPLQTVLSELLVDEINHMTKFWGFGRWAYPQASVATVGHTLTQALVRKLRRPSTQGSLAHTLRRMASELGWSHWSWQQRTTFIYTLDQVMRRLWQWNRTLTPEYLNGLFGPGPSPDPLGH
jgi:AcrR family transcriptional regulator